MNIRVGGSFLVIAIGAWGLSCGDPITVSSENIYGEVDQEVRLNDEGEAIVVWQEDRRDGECLLAAARSRSGEWSFPVTLATQADLSDCHFDLSVSGRVSLFWKEHFKGGEHLHRYVTKEASDEWPSPITLTKAKSDSFFPVEDVAFSSDGSLCTIGSTGPTIPPLPMPQLSSNLVSITNINSTEMHGAVLGSGEIKMLRQDRDTPEVSTSSEGNVDGSGGIQGREEVGKAPQVQIARYVNGNMESLEILKKLQGGRASLLAIHMLADTGICLWQEDSCPSNGTAPVYAAWYSNGEWLQPEEICTATCSRFDKPIIYLDSMGNGVVAIRENKAYIVSTAQNSQWSTTTFPINEYCLQIRCNRHGDVLAIGADADLPSKAVGFFKKANSSTFDQIDIPERLDCSNECSIEVDNSENFIVVWMEAEGRRGTILGAVFSHQDAEWSQVTALLCPTNDRSSYIFPALAWSKAQDRGVISYIFTNGLDAELQVVDLFAD
jgi:hypothetical protein